MSDMSYMDLRRAGETFGNWQKTTNGKLKKKKLISAKLVWMVRMWNGVVERTMR